MATLTPAFVTWSGAPNEMRSHSLRSIGSQRASDLVIRAAYRYLTQANHPDKNSGNDRASARQAEINHAYFVLSDPFKRRRYDQTMALQERLVERRGSDMVAHRHCGSEAGDHQGSRAFAFRPLT